MLAAFSFAACESDSVTFKYDAPEEWIEFTDYDYPDVDKIEIYYLREEDTANLNFILNNNTDGGDIDQSLDALVDFIESLGGNEIVSSEVYEIAGEEGFKIVYNYVDEVQPFKYAQYGFVHGGKNYVFTYTAVPEEFDKYFEEVEAVIDTSRFE